MLALLGTVATASAYDFISGGLAYNINDDGTSVRVTYIQQPNYIGWDEETGLNIYQPSNPNLSDAVTIPASVFNNGVNYTVTDIEQEALTTMTVAPT